jgi:hypothetical protein
MTHPLARRPRALWLAVLVSSLMLAPPAQAASVTLELTGSIFFVPDPSDVFATELGDTYSLFLTYDPDLLPGTLVADTTNYESAAGETSITFSFVSSGGDSFSSDNSFPVRIGIRNTPDFLVTMMAGDGRDRFTLSGQFDPVTKLNLVLLEGPGSNPLSSNDLPLTGFGSGPGTFNVSELDIDRTDLFANISGSVSYITQVTSVPEPSTLALFGFGGLALCGHRRRAAVSRA